MDEVESDFIGLFDLTDGVQQLTVDRQENQLFRSVSKHAENLISRKTHPMLIMSLTQTDHCRKWVRSMLLQHLDSPILSESDFQSDNENQEKSPILLYNQIQFGSAKQCPYYWIFSENNQNCSSESIQMICSLSPAIIIEQTFLQNNGQQFLYKIMDNQIQLFNGKLPQVYLIKRGNDQSSELCGHKFKFTQIVIESDKDVYEADSELLQRVIGHGRQITSNINPQLHKVNIKDHQAGITNSIAISAQMYLQIFNQLINQRLMNDKNKCQSVKQICKAIHEQNCCQTLKKCLEAYKEKMQQLSEYPISNKSLKSAHQRAIDSITENQLFESTNQAMNHQQRLQLEEKLCEQYQIIVENVQRKNYEWFKEMIKDELQKLDQRLSMKDLDLRVPKLVQEILSWRNSILHTKKVQSFTTKDIENCFLTQIIAKTVQISRAGHSDFSEKLSTLEKQLTEQRQVNKQLKNSQRKKTMQLNVQLRSLQQKIAHHKNHEQLLQQTIANLKKQLNQQQMDYDERISEARKEFMIELAASQSISHQLREQLSIRKHELLYQSSEIEKQQLLHAQTKKHYEELLGQCRLRESQLNEKLETAAYEYSENMEEMRNSICQVSSKSAKDLSIDGELFSALEQSTKKNIVPQNAYRQLTQKYEALQTQHQNLAYNFQLLKQENNLQIQELSLSLKLAEQKVCEYKSQILRHSHLLTKLSDLEQHNASLISSCKEKQKQFALMKQEKEFGEENRDILMQKLDKTISENQRKAQQMEQCKRFIEEKRSKVYVEEWVQTDDDVIQQQQLNSALRIIEVLEEQYNLLKLKVTGSVR